MRRSAALEAGGALFEERRDALAEVAGAAGLALQLRLERELGGEVVGEARAQRRLDQPVGGGRALRRAGAARAATVAAKSASGTASQIMPQAAASAAVTGSAKSAAPMARAKPTWRGSQ